MTGRERFPDDEQKALCFDFASDIYEAACAGTLRALVAVATYERELAPAIIYVGGAVSAEHHACAVYDLAEALDEAIDEQAAKADPTAKGGRHVN